MLISLNTNLSEKEKRYGLLMKNRVENEHQIKKSIKAKKELIEETKLNLTVKSNENDVYLPIQAEVEKYILSYDDRRGTVDHVIDYKLIEKKETVFKSTFTRLNEQITKLEKSLEEKKTEMTKYIKIGVYDVSEASSVLKKKEELAKEKKALSEEYGNLTSEKNFAIKKLNTVKNERKTLFKEFFDKLEEAVRRNYAKMTERFDELKLAGKVEFYCTNKEEPYLGDIIILPTPPSKRHVFDIGQLSGGEKSIVLVSFLVSLQEVTGTPFLVLDEIDAFLDAHYEKVIEEILQSIKTNAQILLVTHKSKLIGAADSLIGTYFSEQRKTTVPLSLDLEAVQNN